MKISQSRTKTSVCEIYDSRRGKDESTSSEASHEDVSHTYEEILKINLVILGALRSDAFFGTLQEHKVEEKDTGVIVSAASADCAFRWQTHRSETTLTCSVLVQFLVRTPVR